MYLEIVLNGTSTGRVARFVPRGKNLLVQGDALREIGFDLPDKGPRNLVALGSLDGLRSNVDERAQRILLDAPVSLLDLPRTVLNRPSTSSPAPASASRGALLNYDVHAAHAGSQGASLSGIAELRVFGVGDGVASHTQMATAGRSPDPADDRWRARSVRLDSHWTIAVPESMLKFRVGDSVTAGGATRRSIRMGGLRIGTDFGMQPYRVTTVMPTYFGEVAVPSSVDLYIDGVNRFSGSVPAGPFELDVAPGVSGSGHAQLVVTDALGRQQVVSVPFYAARGLLAPGLTDGSLSLGVARLGYGLDSDHYADEVLASGSLRHGVTDRLTLELHSEGGGGLHQWGLGWTWVPARLGVLSAGVSRSRLGTLGGSQFNLGYQWNSRRLNLLIDTIRAQAGYRDLASLYGTPPPRRTDRAFAGIDTGTMGSVGLSYVRQAYSEEAESRYIGLHWSHAFGPRWSAHSSLTRSLASDREWRAFLGVSVHLGDGSASSVSLQGSPGQMGQSVEVSRPVPGDGGVGWRVRGHRGEGSGHAAAEVSWLGQAVRGSAGFARHGAKESAWAGASGALILMHEKILPSRYVHDAFAVVSTSGVGDVPVKLENRLIGHTDADGLLMVTPLNAWQRNRIAIDPMGLPLGLRIETVDTVAVPRDRAGVLVQFPIVPLREVLATLEDGSGTPLPVGSRVVLRPDGNGEAPTFPTPGDSADEGEATPAVVGYDGQVYFENVDAKGNVLQVTLPDGSRCMGRFDYPEAARPPAQVGPIRCLEGGP